MKKLISVVLSMLMCLWVIPIGAISFAEEYHPFVGSGTAEDPYQIDTAYKLMLLSELVNADDTAADYYDKCYIQTKDIDLKNENFTPIGTYTEDNKGTGFIGDYNGNYNNIYNLYIERAKNYDGLFGWAYGGTIENLTVHGTVNCPDSGAVGGIVGEIGSGSGKYIKNCAFYGDITGKYNIGGIAGGIWHTGKIENCYFNGSVTNTSDNENAGGIVGMVFPGDEEVAGTATINNCYAITNENSGSVLSGVIGHTTKGKNENNTIQVENNYYHSELEINGITGDITNGCSKLSEDLMKSADELLGSPFIHNDDETINNGYPIFEWQGKPYEFVGSGTDEDPYQISSKEDLFAFKQMASSPYFKSKYNQARYIQTADIDLNNESWDSENFYFRGIYDGNYHSIKNLYINTDKSYVGLFSTVSYGSIIKNLIIYGESTGGDSTGGIVGEVKFGGVVENCAFIGDVNCIADGKAGGITAYLWQGGIIRNCYHNGQVSGLTTGVGGIVGGIHTSLYEELSKDVLIENCYHVGKLTGAGDVGAIAGVSGFGDYSNKTEIRNCYYLKNDCATAINGSYTSSDTLAVSQNMLKKAADDLGEAFVTNEDAELNDGYPVFKWQQSEEILYGDANLDGKVSISDAVAILQYLANSEKYYLNEQARKNADVDGMGGVTGKDAAVIQMYDAGVISSFN